MPILTRFDLLCSGVLNFMNYFIVPKNISEMEYFQDRNALQVLILLLSEMDEVWRLVISFKYISFKTGLTINEVERCVLFLEECERINLYRIEKKNPEDMQLYFIEVSEDLLL